MTNIKEQIRAEIERLYDGEAPKHAQQCDFDDGYFTGIGAVSKFLDSLPEEKPSEDLEEAAEEYTQRMLESWRFDSTGCRPPRESFIAGAQWQKEWMMKDAVEYKVCNNLANYPIIYYEVSSLGLKYGDKVKIIIVKEDEK